LHASDDERHTKYIGIPDRIRNSDGSNERVKIL